MLGLITWLRSNRKNLSEFTSYLLLIIACRNTIASAHTNCLIVLLNNAKTARVFAVPPASQLTGEAHYTALYRHRNKYFKPTCRDPNLGPCHLAFDRHRRPKEREL